jgi:short-subunit dehydrogenase
MAVDVVRDLSQSAVVITGASSGIGHAAALAFARRGSRLALAARAPGPLEQVARDCEAHGAEVMWQSVDVRDEERVAAFARRTAERFGRLDVWVNGAGVIAYGRFEQVPTEVFRAVVEINLFGQVHGARAALEQFRRQGSGVLINMASVWGRVTAPDVSAYVASKFAVRAFSECLRQELRDVPGIDVATMLPQAVDTPIFDRAANFAGRSARPMPPVIDPQTVATGIVRCAESPKREITYSRAGRGIELAAALAPSLYGRFFPSAFEAGNYAGEPLSPTAGAVLVPADGAHSIEGGWKGQRRREVIRALRDALYALPRGLRR